MPPTPAHDAGGSTRHLPDGSPEPQWTLDEAGTDARFNRPWRERIDAAATSWLDPVHPVDRARLDVLWRQALDEHTALRTTVRMRMRDASVRWHLLSLAPLDAATGSGWSGLAIDIDDCKRIATTLRAEQDGIARSFAELDHDLRNQLAALAMSAQVLQHDDAPADMRARAQATVQRQAFHVTERIEQFLGAVKATERDTPSVRRVDLGEVLATAREKMADAAAARHLDLICQMPAQTVAIEAEASGLHEAFENLLAHAIDESAAGTLILAIAPGRNGSEIGLRIARPRQPDASPVPATARSWQRGLRLHAASQFAEAYAGCVIVRDDGSNCAATFDLFIPRRVDARV